MARASLGVILALAVAAAGCARGVDDAPAASVATMTIAESDNPRMDAAAAAAREDYAAAEAYYRQALARDPDDALLHFGLGSVLSHLDRGHDAADELRRVLALGRPGVPEVDAARAWLGESAHPTVAHDTTAGDAAVSDASSDDARVHATAVDGSQMPSGTLQGRITWPGIPRERRFAIRIVLRPDETDAPPAVVRGALNASFRRELPEGTYTLSAHAGPLRLWGDVRVTIAAGREAVVDLTPANSLVSPTDFPIAR